ncbi:MAG: PSD1 and planctomycete cytochrome C domain-containing protein [Planctomycetes bacterium]|nr:PSD1 and planctomycete cytochrome C domain-containing protein [Planctomycetota bacterium]
MRFAAVLFLLVGARFISAAEPAPAEIEFFENKIRPLLIDHCYACHGVKKQEAGLRLDSRDAFLKGGDTGPVAVPGDPEKSKLIHAVRYDGKLQMPPKGKLPAEAIEKLVAWVKLGVPYSASAIVAKEPIDAAKLWGYQPVKPVEVPVVINAGEPIDRFILAKLEKQELSLTPRADLRTLIRRTYHDLIGLPPTAEEIEKFVMASNVNGKKAYVELIDRLLASPQYGETQARHWLDLARYSDTKGYVFQEDRNYPYAYTYRDWVIRAFNDDMPYDRFIQLQIAADLMNPKDTRDLAAMGFLTVGRRFLNNTADIIDDRLDVTCRTFLGLTMTCARCHDHKYDPIPAKDYYSLYGVYASSNEPKDLPLIGELARTPEVIAFENEVKKREEELEALKQKLWGVHLAKLRKAETIAVYLIASRDLLGKPNDRLQALARERDLMPDILQRWRGVAMQNPDLTPIFAPLRALAELKDDEFAAKALDLLAKMFAVKNSLNERVVDALKEKTPKTYKEAAETYGRLIAAHFPPKPNLAGLAEARLMAILGPGGVLDVPAADIDRLLDRADKNKLTDLKKKLDAYKAEALGSPPRAMVLNDSPKPFEPYVFLRGNPGNRGPAVPRRFLEALSGPDRKPFTDGSGRLELAWAIADPKNPFTARVMVNRLWIVHFGQGLVRTPSDFGARSDPPTHPELLDYLATSFIESGWSIKAMHRQIMLSRAYQQRSDVSAELAKQDPENRLLARQNRRRIDFENLRDSLLLVSGQLDPAVGGKSVDLFKEPFPQRRTLYGFIDRQNLPGTLRIFDFASPDQHSPQRFTTTVPQQALYLMNSPFVMEQARKLVTRPEVAAKSNPDDRIAILVRLIHGRAATREELSLARAFLNGVDEKSPTFAVSPWQYGFGGFNEQTKRIEGFKLLPHWTGTSWQGGPMLPDPIHGWVILNAAGGHPGNNPTHAAIRRWVSPVDGEVVITGTLKHPDKQGDGVRGRIVSSRNGELGVWKVKEGSSDISLRASVAKGDTLDFATDCVKEMSFDAFTWSTTIRLLEKGKITSWDASRDFAGPSSARLGFGRWEQLAQVFLLGNEFAFVD